MTEKWIMLGWLIMYLLIIIISIGAAIGAIAALTTVLLRRHRLGAAPGATRAPGAGLGIRLPSLPHIPFWLVLVAVALGIGVVALMWGKTLLTYAQGFFPGLPSTWGWLSWLPTTDLEIWGGQEIVKITAICLVVAVLVLAAWSLLVSRSTLKKLAWALIFPATLLIALWSMHMLWPWSIRWTLEHEQTRVAAALALWLLAGMAYNFFPKWKWPAAFGFLFLGWAAINQGYQPEQRADIWQLQTRSPSLLTATCDGILRSVTLSDARPHVDLPPKCWQSLHQIEGALVMIGAGTYQQFPSPSYDPRRPVDRIARASGTSIAKLEIVFCPLSQEWDWGRRRCETIR